MQMNSLRLPSPFRARLGLAALLTGLLAFNSAAPAGELAGLRVGEKAPAFELKNQAGQPIQLAKLLAQGPVAVVFHRSADWCPYCQKHLVALQEGLPEIKAAGLQVVAISYDPVEALERFAKKRGLEFGLLSDPDSQTIKAWKLLNTEAKGKGAGIPHPMTYVLDQNGVIRAKLGHEGYQTRHTVPELIAITKKLPTK
jgi:peroxiredoxin